MSGEPRKADSTDCPSRAGEAPGPLTPPQPTRVGTVRKPERWRRPRVTNNVPFAWLTHAPSDYMLAFTGAPGGGHAVVRARFNDEQELRELAGALKLEGEIADDEL